MSRIAALTLAALALAAGPRTTRAADQPFQLISTADVQKLLGSKDVVVFDVNPDELYAEHHLPGALHLGKKKLASLLPAERDRQLVFYCANTK